MTDKLDDSAGADYVPHHINIAADFAMARYHAPDASLARDDALSILERIIAAHRQTALLLCVSAPPSDFLHETTIENLVDARPESDFGKLLLACFRGHATDFDQVGRLFQAEGCRQAWEEEVILPFLEYSQLPPGTAIR